MKLFKITLCSLVILCTLILNGCGGGGGGGSTSSKPSGGGSGISSTKDITSYEINGIPGTINEANNTIQLTLPFGTGLTNLVATFKAIGDVKVGVTEEVSGKTPNNFTNPVDYKITATDGSTRDFMVTVIAASSSTKDITSYEINCVAGNIEDIDQYNATITLALPVGTNLTNLIATFNATGDVKVGATEEVSSKTPNDFTNPVNYTVTAHDGSIKNFKVTVTTDKPPLPPVTPCSNHTCTQIWSLDQSPNSVALNGPHPGAYCNAASLAKESLNTTGNGKYMITLSGEGHRHTCYVRVDNVFQNNPNHIYLEAAIRISATSGSNADQIWPAFWTTGPDWPFNGEIDIAEGNVNSGFSSLVTWTNLHGRHGAAQGPSQINKFSGLTDFNHWHTYGLEVLKSPLTMHIEITTYLDGNKMTYFNNDAASGDDADDYKDIINGFETHSIIFDADDNNSGVQYTMDVKNVNAYEVN